MPWDVTHTDKCPADKPWGVINSQNGHLHGCHPTQDSARQQQAALYANVNDSGTSRRSAMFTKAGPAVEVKITNEEKGEVQAVFSTLNVKDKDGDVTEPGAFGEQNVRISAYNHQSWNDELPIGKGTIGEQGNTAVLNGQFFLSTSKGRDTFHVIKELGDLMEWSYGFDIDEKSEGKWPKDAADGEDVRFLKKLKVHEVSPVILGAGVDTRTLSAKGAPKTSEELITVLDSAMNNLTLIDHTKIMDGEFERVVTRIAEVVTLRAEEGKQVSEPVQKLAMNMLTCSDRLREVLTNVPTDNAVNPKEKELAQAIFRDARSLLHLTGGYDGS